MNSRLLTVWITALILISFACSSDPAGDDTGEFLEVNDWIRSNMEAYYYWNDLVPESADGFLPPNSFFESMLEPSDVFSYLSDDADALVNDLNGSSFTEGYSPLFGRFSNSDNVFIIVEFVYPETPAEEAGLERGDIILKIDGQQLTINNYLDLYYQDSQSVDLTLGEYDAETNSISEGETVTVSKLQMELDPVVHTQIFENNGEKTAYMFYSRFLNGDTDQFIQSVDGVLEEFQAEGISELIVDLRYNRGGRVSAAVNLGNSIAPLSVVADEEVFVSYEYNADYQQAIEDQQGPDSPNLVTRFSDDPVNLNLERVFFLTTSSSASASELLINGLSPHMDVITIGTPTYGKFYGSYVFTGDEAVPPNNYAIVPVVLKYANSAGMTDFRNGLQPDYTIEENLLEAKALGDSTDPLLGKALELITGEEVPAKAPLSIPYEILDNQLELKKGNAMFDPKSRIN